MNDEYDTLEGGKYFPGPGDVMLDSSSDDEPDTLSVDQVAALRGAGPDEIMSSPPHHVVDSNQGIFEVAVSELRKRKTPPSARATHDLEEEDDSASIGLVEQLRLWWHVHCAPHFSMDFWVEKLYARLRKMDEDNPESDTARRVAKALDVVRANSMRIAVILAIMFVIMGFAHYVLYGGSSFVQNTSPWEENYNTYYAFHDIYEAFARGNVVRTFETDAGVLSGTFPTSESPSFVHDTAIQSDIDALKESLEKDALDFCTSRHKPAVVCPPMSGIAMSMITICSSGQHLYNPRFVKGDLLVEQPHQLETFLPYDHAIVQERGFLRGVSMRARFTHVTLSHSDWEGEHSLVLEGGDAVSVQVCLDLIDGEIGSLLDDIPISLFLG